MRNGNTVGLFQNMFEKNILTFNPGWDENGNTLDSFSDVRDLQKQIKAKRIAFELQTDGSVSGPASFIIADPDGNPILVDQHI